jgi:serine/threonine protein phosphatase 1
MESPFIPRLPEGMRLYAIGDVHGRADLLEKMLRLIKADCLGFRGTPIIVLLGDYMDRGPFSREVLEILTHPKASDFPLQPIMGNHEDIILRFFKDHSVAPGWFHYGGLQTLRSYGIPIADATQDFDDIFYLRSKLEAAMPQAHRDFMQNLPLMKRFGDYVFVHAGVHPDRPIEEQDPHHLLWMREPFLSSKKELGYMVVHGHTIRIHPDVRVNRIGIDTGAYASNHLTALVLQGDTQSFIHT